MHMIDLSYANVRRDELLLGLLLLEITKKSCTLHTHLYRKFEVNLSQIKWDLVA